MKIMFCFLFIVSLNIIFCHSETNATPLNKTESKDLIYEAITSTKGLIFKQLRYFKENFHPQIQNEIEKSIKQYEFRYLSNKDDFIDFLWDRFEELKYFGKFDDKNLDFNQEIFDFLKEFYKFYSQLNDSEKKKVDIIIENEEPFTKGVLKSAMQKSIIFEDHKFTDLQTIIEQIPLLLLNKTNKSDMKKSNFKHKKINSDFSEFLGKMEEEYKIKDIHLEKSHSVKQQKIAKLLESFQPKHVSWFSSFLEEYLQEAVINNDNFKEIYTMDRMMEMDLPKAKAQNSINEKLNNFVKNKRNMMNNTMNNANNNSSNNSTNSTNTMNETEKNKMVEKSGGMNITETKKLISSNLKKKPNKTQLEKKKKENMKTQTIIEKNRAKREEEKKKAKIDLSGSCDEKEAKLQKALDSKLEKIEEAQDKYKDDLKEVPQEIMDAANDPDSASSMAKNMILEFIKKMITLAIQHIPFYFFKFCIPPGPLVFGCCPEAGFFPQQIYNIFTAFEKVDKFKTLAKGYPDWLSATGHENFNEIQYYICAQSYLTVHMSALFNICSPLSLIYVNPLNLLGLIPGDMPMCFYSCIQTMITCQVSLEMLGPCDAIINLQTVIKAIFIIPLRLRIISSFTACSYIPFLIRWDLVPPWTHESNTGGEGENENGNGGGDGGDGKNNQEDDEPSCVKEEPKKESRSPYEQALLDLNPDNAKIINSIQEDVPVKEDIGDRGLPVNRKRDRRKLIDINADFRMGKRIADADSNTDVISTIEYLPHYSNDMIYHILTYGKESSKIKEKDFPFHTKRIYVDDWIKQ